MALTQEGIIKDIQELSVNKGPGPDLNSMLTNCLLLCILFLTNHFPGVSFHLLRNAEISHLSIEAVINDNYS